MLHFKWPLGFGITTEHFILHEGPPTVARELLLAAGVWSDQLHDDIWVYNQGWQKNPGLWQEIQKASWDAVILEEDFKRAVQKDVFGFFSSKDTYKELTLPWKEIRKRLFWSRSLSNYFPCSAALFSMDHLVDITVLGMCACADSR